MELKPRMRVRRFDVFAEYNRLEALQKGQSEAETAGHGLWVAKVVASGGGRGTTGSKPRTKSDGENSEGEKDESETKKKSDKPEWRSLNGEDQTDAMFEDEIIRRMGREFYYEVFQPAIEKAFQEEKSYTQIRDTIRRDWTP